MIELENQEQPEVIVLKEIEDKLLFLLQINPSIDLSSQILEGDNNGLLINRLKSSQELNLLRTGDNYSGFEKSSDSDIGMQRSKSAVIGALGKGQLQKTRKQARGSKARSGFMSNRAREQREKDTISSSSFSEVVAFVTNSAIRNLDVIKENIDVHYATADNRLQGLDYLCKIYRTVICTNQPRSIISPLTTSVGNNPFLGVEASGIERLKKLNLKIKEALKNCIIMFVNNSVALKQTVEEFVNTRQSQAGKLKDNGSRSSSHEELILISQIRGLLECLNDMIVLLSDNPAKEAFILHIVLEFTQTNVKFSEFLTHLIGLILDTKDSLIVLNKLHISETLISETQTAAKLLLNKFIIKDTEESQLSLNAHILLQETLLEIIVNILKREMQTGDFKQKDAIVENTEQKDSQNAIQKFLATKYQRLVTLFLMLKSVLTMSQTQDNLKEEIRNSCLEIVSECITTESDFKNQVQQERSFSTRVIRAACEVANLCLDKDKISKLFGKNKNESFINMALKKIGQCIIGSDMRAQVALEHFILPNEEQSEAIEEEEKKALEENEKETKMLHDPSSIDNNTECEEDYFTVYATINNNSDDRKFIMAALEEIDKTWNLTKKDQNGKDNSDDTQTVVTDSTGKIEENSKTEDAKDDGVKAKCPNALLLKLSKDIKTGLKTKGTI